MGRLDGKVAVITGGTSGIGRRTVELFVREGASVVFTGRRQALGEEIVGALGDRAVYHNADVAKEAEVQATIRLAIERFGRLDCLFNNAGCPAPRGGVEGLDMGAVEQATAVLFNGVVMGIKHAAPAMKAQGSGSIINNASIASHLAGYSSSMIYSALKAAVRHFARCAAMELGESGIRVNSISPGAIATGIFGKVLGLEDAKAEASARALEAAFKEAQPIKRAGLPDDIAYAALFLASDESSFVNGTDIVVDGGMIGGRQWTPLQQAYAQMQAAFGAMPEG